MSSNIYGLIGSELKTDTDLFRKIVNLPHHTFSANPQDEVDIELKATRLKQRWNRLVNGKRQNPNDVKFEEAIRSYINTELKESDEKKTGIQWLLRPCESQVQIKTTKVILMLLHSILSKQITSR